MLVFETLLELLLVAHVPHDDDGSDDFVLLVELDPHTLHVGSTDELLLDVDSQSFH